MQALARAAAAAHPSTHLATHPTAKLHESHESRCCAWRAASAALHHVERAKDVRTALQRGGGRCGAVAGR